ncbi:uncharacterized protein TrAFT101_000559 [Trichoderma asperellum]|uniref:uncharacterized protein n=1 Tax=Trichoderma asperellum TaxID=101201 RepID=UPI003333A1A3|nr:hypothetical protein TrAFT101_000559 [Trichoderma asperellum]
MRLYQRLPSLCDSYGVATGKIDIEMHSWQSLVEGSERDRPKASKGAQNSLVSRAKLLSTDPDDCYSA